jgi:hypothetical protein
MSGFLGTVLDSSHVRVDRAWLELDRTGPWHSAGLRAGEFDAELPFLSARRRSTLTPYLAPVTIDARGFEIRQELWKGAVGAGLVQSHRALSEVERLQDTYVWARQGWGSAELGARVWFDREDSYVPPLPWLQHLQYLVAGRWTRGGLEIVPAYLQDRFDDQPVIKNHDKHRYFLLETVVPLDRGGRWSATARCERFYRTRTPTTPEEDSWLGVANLAYQVKSNAQIAVEWSDRTRRMGEDQPAPFDVWLRVAL